MCILDPIFKLRRVNRRARVATAQEAEEVCLTFNEETGRTAVGTTSATVGLDRVLSGFLSTRHRARASFCLLQSNATFFQVNIKVMCENKVEQQQLDDEMILIDESLLLPSGADASASVASADESDMMMVNGGELSPIDSGHESTASTPEAPLTPHEERSATPCKYHHQRD